MSKPEKPSITALEHCFRVVAFRRAFVDIVGCVKAALLLSQAVYWASNPEAVRRGGWFYKTAADWQYELGMTSREQRTARKKLVEAGVLEEDLRGQPAKMWFRVDLKALAQRLQDIQVCANRTTDDFGESEADNSGDESALQLERKRTTTKTTAQTTPDTPPENPVEVSAPAPAHVASDEPDEPAEPDADLFLAEVEARAADNGWQKPYLSAMDRLYLVKALQELDARPDTYRGVVALLSRGAIERPGKLCSDHAAILRSAVEEATARRDAGEQKAAESAAEWEDSTTRSRLLRAWHENEKCRGNLTHLLQVAGVTLEEYGQIADPDLRARLEGKPLDAAARRRIREQAGLA